MAELSPTPSIVEEDVDVLGADPTARVEDLDDPRLPDPSGFDAATASPIKAHTHLKEDGDA